MSTIYSDSCSCQSRNSFLNYTTQLRKKSKLEAFRKAYYKHDLAQCQDILESVGIELAFHAYFLAQFNYDLRRGVI